MVFVIPIYSNGMHNQPEPLGTNPVPNAITTQALGAPEKSVFNASISYVARNVTVKQSTDIVLEDRITLQINNESSRIGILNYTVPTAFDRHVVKAQFWSNYATDISLDTSNNVRTYTKFQGVDATTYYIDIKINGTLANETDNTYVMARLTAVNAITFYPIQQDEYGTFVSPVMPIFPNLRVDDGLLGMTLQATQDSFLTENMTKINYANQDWPVKRNAAGTLMEWRNMTREPYEVTQNLRKNWDYTTVLFQSKTTGDGSHTTTIPFVLKSAVQRTQIDPWGTVFVHETWTVLHTGAPFPSNSSNIARDYGLTQVDFLVSKNAKITDVYDEYGSLNGRLRDSKTAYPTTSIDTTTNKQKLTVNFRNAIYGGDVYTFTVDYRYKGSDILTKSGNHYTLNTTMFSDFNTTVYDLRSIFKLPATAKLDSYTWVSQSHTSDVNIKTHVRRDTLNFFRHIELEFNIQNANFVDNTHFQIVYTYSGLGHVGYIFTFMIMTALILGVGYMLSQFQSGFVATVDKTKETIPVDKIESFYNLFSDRAGAILRISELREKRKKGKVNKVEYDGQMKALQRRIREINPQLEKAAADLSAEGTKYSSYVDKIMLASQKQVDIRTNTDNARKSYLKGDTPKNIYQRMIREYSRDFTKQESVITKNLSELAELIQEYS